MIKTNELTYNIKYADYLAAISELDKLNQWMAESIWFDDDIFHKFICKLFPEKFLAWLFRCKSKEEYLYAYAAVIYKMPDPIRYNQSVVEHIHVPWIHLALYQYDFMKKCTLDVPFAALHEFVSYGYNLNMSNLKYIINQRWTGKCYNEFVQNVCEKLGRELYSDQLTHARLRKLLRYYNAEGLNEGK